MAPKVKDMKITKSEREEERGTAIAASTPEFPFGLSLHLEEDTIAKLGLDKLPSPGEDGTIAGKVRIESASIRRDDDGERRSLTLQITKLGFEPGTKNLEEESERVDKNNGGPPQASIEKVLFADG